METARTFPYLQGMARHPHIISSDGPIVEAPEPHCVNGPRPCTRPHTRTRANLQYARHCTHITNLTVRRAMVDEKLCRKCYQRLSLRRTFMCSSYDAVRTCRPSSLATQMSWKTHGDGSDGDGDSNDGRGRRLYPDWFCVKAHICPMAC